MLLTVILPTLILCTPPATPKFPATPLVKAEAAFVTLPAEIKASPGAFIPIVPQTNGKVVRYHSSDEGISLFPAEMLADPRNTVAVAQQAGRYRVLAYTAVGDVPSLPAVVTIIVGNPPVPVPPGPLPVPVPVPPVRPTGLAGECYDKMKDFPKGELRDIAAILAVRTADSNLWKTIVKSTMDAMAAKRMPGIRWTPMVDWLRGRISDMHEADGTPATDAEIASAYAEWQKAAEALIAQ